MRSYFPIICNILHTFKINWFTFSCEWNAISIITFFWPHTLRLGERRNTFAHLYPVKCILRKWVDTKRSHIEWFILRTQHVNTIRHQLIKVKKKIPEEKYIEKFKLKIKKLKQVNPEYIWHVSTLDIYLRAQPELNVRISACQCGFHACMADWQTTEKVSISWVRNKHRKRDLNQQHEF